MKKVPPLNSHKRDFPFTIKRHQKIKIPEKISQVACM